MAGTLSGERGDVSDTAVEDWKSKLPVVCDGYAPKDIFNMAETSLLQHTCNCFLKFGLTYDQHMAATSLWWPLLSSPTSGCHRQVRLYIYFEYFFPSNSCYSL